MKRYFFIYAVLLVAAILLLDSCIKTIGPEPSSEEPDTAKSSLTVKIVVSDTLTYWNFRRFDTLSPGTIGRINSDRSHSTREGLVLRPTLLCIYNKKIPSLEFNFTRLSNLVFTTYTIPLGRIDSLRKWIDETLTFFISFSETKEIPYRATSIRVFSWRQSQVNEYLLSPSLGGSWDIMTSYDTLFDISYGQFDNYSNTNVNDCEVIIDKFDRNKKRVWGRFKFKIGDKANPQNYIEALDGIFENVQVLEQTTTVR